MIDVAAIATMFKTVGGVLKSAGKIEELAQIIDLQGTVLGVLDENSRLRAELADRKEKDEIARHLQYDGAMYWTGAERTVDAGPYCSRCWDVDRKLVRINFVTRDTPQCPACKMFPTPDGRTLSPGSGRVDSEWDPLEPRRIGGIP